MTTTSTPLRLNRPSIIDETIDGEVVAVDLNRGWYYSIRGTGVDIWHLLAEPVDRDALVERVAARFRERPEAIADVVLAFVDALHGAALVREEPGDTPALDLTALPEGSGLQSFQPPQLEQFGDMEDLLMLDPIDDVGARGWPHERDAADRVDAQGWPEARPAR